jgi:hypothetical protein
MLLMRQYQKLVKLVHVTVPENELLTLKWKKIKRLSFIHYLCLHHRDLHIFSCISASELKRIYHKCFSRKHSRESKLVFAKRLLLMVVM